MSYIDKLKKISEKRWFYPVVLLLMGFITYNYVLTSLGYYWADWEIVMFIKLNPLLRFEYYVHDRPFPWTYQLINFFIGSNPIGWHIITLLIRWAGTLFFVHALILIWPRYKKHFFWLGALLLFYPGFLQQTQSATKARHIMTLLLFALSLYLMALAIRRPKWAHLLFPLSWVITFVHLFTTEYFSGFELIRPVLIWILYTNSNQKDSRLLKRVVLTSLPYLVLTAFFFWSRFVYFPRIFQTTSRLGEINSTMSGLQESIPAFFLDMFSRVSMDLLYSTLQVWINAITSFDGFSLQRVSAWFAFALGILLTLVFAFFHDTDEEGASDNSSPTLIFLVGFGSYIVSALPIWAIGKEVSTGGWNDRFALAPMLGAGLMVMALLLWFVRPAGQKLILSVLLVFSIAAQVWTVNIYRRDWSTQLDYYWQLYWRVPALESNTTVFSYEQPSPFVTHYSDAGYALNVLYNYQTEDGFLPYWFIIRKLEAYSESNKDIRVQIRGLEFNGNSSDAIAVLHQTNESCLRVLDEVYRYDTLYLEGQDALIPVSNLSRIIPDPVPVVPPDRDIFGPEPAHTWCYFFEKADLARQTQDWDTIIDLYNQAQQLGFSPEYGAEYIPFIEAYAQKGDWQKAYDLTIVARHMSLDTLKMLCSNWKRLSKLPSADMKYVDEVYQAFSCYS